MDKTYSIKEICRELNIQESTLRKYAIAMEKANYEFDRTEKGRRIYTFKNVITLKEILEVKSKSDITLEKAIYKVLKVVDPYEHIAFMTKRHQEQKEMMERYYIQRERMKDEEIFYLKSVITELESAKSEMAATKRVKKSWWNIAINKCLVMLNKLI